MARRPRERNATSAPASGRGIRIDIPGVQADTKISDLTVEQFVQLIDQVRQQFTAPRRAANARRAAMTAKFVELLSSDNEDVVAVKQALSEIGRKLPAVLLEVAKEMGRRES